MRKLNRTIKLRISMDFLCQSIAASKNPCAGTLTTLLGFGCGRELPADCEVVSAIGGEGCIIVTLWHESFPEKGAHDDVVGLKLARAEMKGTNKAGGPVTAEQLRATIVDFYGSLGSKAGDSA